MLQLLRTAAAADDEELAAAAAVAIATELARLLQLTSPNEGPTSLGRGVMACHEDSLGFGFATI